MFGKRKIAMVLAEFFGVIALTTTLLAIGKSGVGYSYFLAGGVGLTAAAFALAVGSVSGAHFNPAVSAGFWVTRKISTTQAVAFIAAQMAGGFAAWKIYEYLTGQPLTSTAKDFDWRVLVAEAIGGFIIVFVISSAVYLGYKGLKMAATIGGAIFAGALIASLGSNGIANPAIALGVRSWSTPYVVGPLIGGIVGAVMYAYVFVPQVAASAATKAKVVKASATPAKKKPAARKKK